LWHDYPRNTLTAFAARFSVLTDIQRQILGHQSSWYNHRLDLVSQNQCASALLCQLTIFSHRYSQVNHATKSSYPPVNEYPLMLIRSIHGTKIPPAHLKSC